jgi:hypothetical protein
LDGTLSEKRDKLGKAKATRDTLRQKGRRIKESSVFITNPLLLDDIEVGRYTTVPWSVELSCFLCSKLNNLLSATH